MSSPLPPAGLRLTPRRPPARLGSVLRRVVAWLRPPSVVSAGAALLGWSVTTLCSTILALYVSSLGVFLGRFRGIAPGTDPAFVGHPVVVPVLGLAEALTLLGITFLSFYSGAGLSGLLGGRAGTRVSWRGIGQGVRTWVWALVAAIVVVLVARLSRSGTATVLTTPLTVLNSFPPLPVVPFATPVDGAVTAAALAVVGLGGALAGGIAGAHRRVTPRPGGTTGRNRSSQP